MTPNPSESKFIPASDLSLYWLDDGAVMHCHPMYQGLVQYQNQDVADEGNAAVPLFFSSCFLAQLTRLFLKQVPDGWDMLRKEFTERELSTFKGLSQMCKS